jgi:serine-type D-Ala-D-Ala carboxypeptidase/endopeptidase
VVTILQLNRALVWWVSSLTLVLQVIPFCEAQTPSTPATADLIERLGSIVDQTAGPFTHDSCHADCRLQSFGVQNHGSITSDRPRAAHTKPTADSVYEIASLTKTFTGALAAEALLEHRMLLDADFREYLPESIPNWNCKDDLSR